MKISPYLNIERIEFIVTYYCTGKCIHCSIGDKLNHADAAYQKLDVKQVSGAIKQLRELFPVTSVMTFGGEPLLFPDVVCALHHTAALCGIESRQLITNGYFSNNEKRIQAVADSLNASGVSHLLLSVDAFHQQTIPFEIVYKFAEYVKQAGLINIRLHPAWLVNERQDNPYNIKTKELLSEFSKLNIPVSSGNDITMAGNAVTYLSEYYAPPGLNWSDCCGQSPYTASLNNVASLSIVPNGNVMVCGFTTGNIYTESIADIVSRYNPDDNTYMRAILSGGAFALWEAAKANGISVDCSYCYSLCDLCHKINSAGGATGTKSKAACQGIDTP